MSHTEAGECRTTSVQMNSELRYLPCTSHQHSEGYYDTPPPSYSEARANPAYSEGDYENDIPPPKYSNAAISNPPVTRMQFPTIAGYIQPPTTVQTTEAESRQEVEKVPDYLYFSVFVTLCCCFCLGIPAIIFSRRANLLREVDPMKARQKAGVAKCFILASVMVGIAATVFVIFLRPV